MESKKVNLRFGIIGLIILLAAMSRCIPHPQNFAPIGAIALLGAAYYSKRYWAFLVPIIALFVSDLVLNNFVYDRAFYSISIVSYLSLALIVLLGTVTLKKVRLPRLIGTTLSASVIFFLVSNFGVWLLAGSMGEFEPMYPQTFTGLMACYAAGIPFFKNTLLGDIVYTGVLFGVFELLLYRFPVLRTER